MVHSAGYKVGDKFTNFQGSEAVIVTYDTARRVTLKFLDEYGFEVTVQANKLKIGRFKNPYAPSVRGVGFVGAGKFVGSGRTYLRWKAMLDRCYSGLERHKAYADCSVSTEWLNFQKFAEWFESNGGKNSWATLDKDILVKGNRVYSDSTCCIVPNEINSLFISSPSSAQGLPSGVRINGSKYTSRVCTGSGTYINLGQFACAEEAFQAYKKTKESHIKEMAVKFREVLSVSVFDTLLSWEVERTD